MIPHHASLVSVGPTPVTLPALGQTGQILQPARVSIPRNVRSRVYAAMVMTSVKRRTLYLETVFRVSTPPVRMTLSAPGSAMVQAHLLNKCHMTPLSTFSIFLPPGVVSQGEALFIMS